MNTKFLLTFGYGLANRYPKYIITLGLSTNPVITWIPIAKQVSTWVPK